ncbi:hypothetical protein ACDN41_11905 [Priestia aryabhattai]|uniref:hypothetical protein n=1 Tax=Priestia aryabhattai TaxID=412384 RepID=UPI003531A1C6
MLKVGDKLVDKAKFSLKNNLTSSDREFTIKELWRQHDENQLSGVIENKSGNLLTGHFSLSNFYITESLNDMIQTVIDKEEIKSFKAITIDGKEISMELNSDNEGSHVNRKETITNTSSSYVVLTEDKGKFTLIQGLKNIPSACTEVSLTLEDINKIYTLANNPIK